MDVYTMGEIEEWDLKRKKTPADETWSQRPGGNWLQNANSSYLWVIGIWVIFILFVILSSILQV